MDINKEEILSVLKELHHISGLRISLHGTDYKEIAAYPEYNLPFCEYMHGITEEYDRCMACDKEACEIALTTKKTYIYRHAILSNSK